MPSSDTLYYETCGDKTNTPVVFLHGFLGSGRDWTEIIDLLNSDYFCVTIDLPGHGNSADVGKHCYQFENCAHSIVSIAAELGLSKFDLVGYSMGGRLALYTALNFPDKISKLVIESASPGLKTENERKARVESDNLLADKIQNTPITNFVNDWYQQPIFQSLKLHPEKLKSMIHTRQKNSPDGLANSLKFMGTGVQQSFWEKLDKLPDSTHLIVGEVDSKFQAIAGEMRSLSDKIRVATIPDCGHNVHFEKPAEFAKTLKDFLK